MNLLISAMVVAFSAHAEPVPKLPKAMKPDEFLKQCEAQEKMLIEYFTRDDLWEKKNRKETILNLKLASKLKPSQLLPELIKNITCRDDMSDVVYHSFSFGDDLPVYLTLVSYGKSAYLELFKHIRRDVDYQESEKSKDEHFFYILLLESMFHTEIETINVVQQIEKEIKRYPDTHFPRLEAFYTYAEKREKNLKKAVK